jgi:hypothetical protein
MINGLFIIFSRATKDINNSYVVADGIEIGYKNKIPLWVFGFLY